MKLIVVSAAFVTLSIPAAAQEAAPATPLINGPAPTVESAKRTLLPGTMFVVTPAEEISSKKVKEGDKFAFTVVNDVVENGVAVIQRNTPVQGTVTWKTGRAIGGKSGKFEITFNSITMPGGSYRLRGKHRQEGRGNTVGALLGSILISGRSAVMEPGQMVNVFTDEPIYY